MYNGYNYDRVVEIIVANNRVNGRNLPGIGGPSYDTLSLVWLLTHCRAEFSPEARSSTWDKLKKTIKIYFDVFFKCIWSSLPYDHTNRFYFPPYTPINSFVCRITRVYPTRVKLWSRAYCSSYCQHTSRLSARKRHKSLQHGCLEAWRYTGWVNGSGSYPLISKRLHVRRHSNGKLNVGFKYLLSNFSNWWSHCVVDMAY